MQNSEYPSIRHNLPPAVSQKLLKRSVGLYKAEFVDEWYVLHIQITDTPVKKMIFSESGWTKWHSVKGIYYISYYS